MRVHGLATGGDGVGRQQGGAHDGRATFVPLAAPGDEVTARVVREKARVAWAEVVKVRTPSPLRVAPPCPYFGACGGCQWQHVTLDAQRAAKREIVTRALQAPVARALQAPAETSVGAPLVELLAPSESGFGYRDRARFVVGQRGALGFRARRSHDVVDIDSCPLLTAEAGRALTAVRAQAPSLAPETEVDLQVGAEGVHVAVRSRAPLAASLCASLFEWWGADGVVGAVMAGGADAARTFGLAEVDVSEPGAAPLRIPAGGFAQVGRAANAVLVGAVMRAVGEAPGDVLELYAGSGNFTRHLLARAARVVAHDADARAVDRGRRNAPLARWHTGGVPSGAEARSDLTVVDPPREGLDPENFAAAIQTRRRLVYVSCDPQTLARDAAKLATRGLVLRQAVALDLMPQTFHTEVVAAFDRG